MADEQTSDVPIDDTTGEFLDDGWLSQAMEAAGAASEAEEEGGAEGEQEGETPDPDPDAPPAEGTPKPGEGQEPAKAKDEGQQEPPPDPEEGKSPAQVKAVRELVDLELQKRELEQQRKSFEEERKQIQAMRDEAGAFDPLKFKENPHEHLRALADKLGEDPVKVYERMTMSLLSGKGEKPKPEDVALSRVERLEKELQSFRKTEDERREQAEVQQLRAGVRSLVSAESHPLLAALGGEAQADLVANEILAQYRRDGTAPKAADILKQREEAVLADLKQVVGNPKVREILGLSEPTTSGTQQAERRETPTLTAQDTTAPAGEDEDYWKDEDKLIQLAAKAAREG